MTDAEEERLSQEVDRILKENRIESMLECQVCGAELTLRMEVIPGPPPAFSRLAYNCQYCFSMNVVWTAPGTTI
jgi:hypothetical protein